MSFMFNDPGAVLVDSHAEKLYAWLPVKLDNGKKVWLDYYYRVYLDWDFDDYRMSQYYEEFGVLHETFQFTESEYTLFQLKMIK